MKTVLIILLSAIILCLFATATNAMADQPQVDEPNMQDPLKLKLFTAGEVYLGKYETGLYPGGTNQIPQTHRLAGEKIAATIVPLDANGTPDENNGTIVALVMGHSNANMYFGALQKYLKTKTDELNPRFELLNAAMGGQQLPEISTLSGKVWDKAAELLSAPAHSPNQVQVLFFHTTYHGWKNLDNKKMRAFPELMQQMNADLAKVLQHCVKIYPNLKIAYLTCDGFRYYTGFEPHVWHEAFGFKWLIESQIKGDPGTAFEGEDRKLPWLTWGPYIWDNSWDESYFTDGVHPADKSRAIFVEKYWNHLKNDTVTKNWMFKPAGVK